MGHYSLHTLWEQPGQPGANLLHEGGRYHQPTGPVEQWQNKRFLNVMVFPLLPMVIAVQGHLSYMNINFWVKWGVVDPPRGP